MRRTCLRLQISARLTAWLNRSVWLIALFILSAVISSAQNPANPEGWVVLPVDDYRALRQAAFPSEREPEPPSVEATLTRVDYDLKVDGDLATGEVRLTIDVIKDGWAR